MNYPEFRYGTDRHIVYYVEFNRSGVNNSFTLFRRNFIYDENKFPKNSAHYEFLLLSSECHPFQILSGTFGNGFPNEAWVRWMVDSLNSSHKNISN